MGALTDLIENFRGGRAGRTGGGGSGGPLTVGETVNVGSPQDLMDRAQGVEDEERTRYRAGHQTIRSAYDASQAALRQEIDPNLLFSQAKDQVGARARRSLEAMRSSFSSRGLNLDSAAGRGLQNRLIGQANNALTGATRDIAIDQQQRRRENAALSFSQALGFANYQNQPVPMATTDMAMNISEQNLAREGLASQERSTRAANQTNLIGSGIGAAASIIGGLI